jgi:Zn-dependent protease
MERPAIDMTVEAAPDEALYQAARQELATPRPARNTGLLPIALFLLFVAGQFGELMSLSGVVVLVLAILFHEAGHAAGMRLFGFRDVRMFFIPFFGAAVSGRPRGVAAWKEALVSLLGPLPGILAGLACFLLNHRRPTPLSISAAQVLLFLNTFNLLPFGFLDGGRFLGRVLFSRNRVLEMLFTGLGSLFLAMVAFRHSLLVLGGFALFGLVVLPLRWRVLQATATLRRQDPAFRPDPDTLGDAHGRALFAAARKVLRAPARDKASSLAATMEAIVEAVKPAPRALATVGLMMLYGVGLLAGTFGIVMVASETGPARWKIYEQGDWRADFPQIPLQFRPRTTADGVVEETWRAVVEGTQRFTVMRSEGRKRTAADAERWMDEASRRLAGETGTALVGSRAIEVAGVPGREFELASAGRVVRARLLTSGNRRYQVVASAPAWGENQRRFLDSFTITGPAAIP